MKIIVDIIKEDKNWKSHKDIKISLVKNVIKMVIAHFPNLAHIKQMELAILLTNDDKMQELNKQFRSKDRTTNVLSFPDMIEDLKKVLEFGESSDYIRLGDLAFGYDVVKKEATEQDKCFEHHFMHLLVHGILHLLGLDHETSQEDADIMENAEIEILKLFDIDSPY